ncbi:hypothetical protein CHUAL_006912 [Chamberlinius hualienensis]
MNLLFIAAFFICLPTLFVVSNGEELAVWQERSWTLCLDSFWNSCVGRCGQSLYGPPYLCACDSLCKSYDDCCLDYEYECTWNIYDGNRTTTAMPLFSSGRMSCVGLATIMEYGVLMVSSCAPWWPKDIGNINRRNSTKGLCLAPDPSSLKPVIGTHFGYIYKNIYCAKCNGVIDTEPWKVVIKCSNSSQNNHDHHWFHDWLHACTIELDFNGINSSHARACAYKVGQCPVPTSSEEDLTSEADDNVTLNNALTFEEESMCPTYSKPIMVPNNDQSMTIYKNIHCARCNGHCFNNLYCPQWEFRTFERKEDDGSLEMTKTFYYETGISADTRGKPLPNLPASFSVLFFFHQSGLIQTLFSSHDDKWWNACDDNQIWDPFWQTCRDVYCSTIFSFLNFKCIIVADDSGSSTDIDGNNITSYSNVTQMDNVDVTQVQLVFHVMMQFPIDDEMETVLKDDFGKTMATSMNFSSNRLTNFMTYNESYVNDTYTNSEIISMVLLGPLKNEQKEPTIEKIVGTIAYGVSLDQFWLNLSPSGYMVKVFGIQEKIIQLSNSTTNDTDDHDNSNEWCPDGRQVVYQNEQFTPIVHPYSGNNISMSLYINSTGITYLPGQFIANIVMDGPQGSALVNVSGIAIVCDLSYHNNSCLRIMISPKDYTPLPNGSIICNSNVSGTADTYVPSDYEILPNGNALICLPISLPTVDPQTVNSYKKRLKDLNAQSYLTTILLSISSTALFATIVTYLLFKSMRNVPGWIILNLCFCLLTFQLLYLAGMRFTVYLNREVCKGVAIFLHWTILSTFFWMNVTAFDLYRAFSHLLTSPMAKKASKKTLIYYGIYSYGCSSCVVITCICLDEFSRFEIGYGEGGWCWIGNTLALAVAFAGVIGLILLANFIFYVLTIYCIRRMASKASMVAGYSASRNQLTIYARISTVMGFSWALGYLEGVPSFSYVLHDIFAYAFIIANCLSGVFIFIAFVCNRKALQLYKQSPPMQWVSKYWSKAMTSKCNECKQSSDKCACPKTVSRTISNETRQSIISDNEEDNDQQINTADDNKN